MRQILVAAKRAVGRLFQGPTSREIGSSWWLRFGSARNAMALFVWVGVTVAPGRAATIYVSPGGSDASSGQSWTSAKQTVTAGLAAAVRGDQVWVAAGTYAEHITLKEGVALYGGFAGMETQLAQRNWMLQVAVLDGGASGTVVNVPECDTASATIDGFTMRNGAGGVVCVERSKPIIVHNIISDNSGAGIIAHNCAISILNNTISGNRSCGISTDGCVSTIANNLILGNGGGGIWTQATAPVATITNNTIVGNCASPGGGIYCFGGATIANNIVAYNSSGVYWAVGDMTMRNNCVFNPGGYNYAGEYSSLPPGPGDIFVDPQLQAADYGQVHLKLGSPCINTGYASAVQAGWTDMDGQPRTQGGQVDIGADESNGSPPVTFTPAILRVHPSGNDANDGSSWALAKRTVQAAITAAPVIGGEVWVATGTYSERITLKRWVHVYGGFAGTETSFSQRNARSNVTVLDGAAAGSVVSALAGSGISLVDGFTLRNGTGTSTNSASYGGGVYCAAAMPIIVNNTITGNAGVGGGVYAAYSACPTISFNTIRKNNGGGIDYAGTGVFANNLIEANSAGTGAGIYCEYAAVGLICNNTITCNTAISGRGGGICCSGSATIVNNTITANTDNGSGGGIFCVSQVPTISNNIVAFNGSGIGATSTAPVLRNNCVYNPGGANYLGLSAGSGDISVDPQLCAVPLGEVHLLANSPCINAGLDSALQSGWLDMDGQARTQSGRVDIGADEFNGTAPPPAVPVIVRVSPWGDNANDGSSWAAAKRTVQAGIDAASAGHGEVWVAAGVYGERIELKPWAYMYGGFSGVETSREQRNWTINATILDGGGLGSTVSIVSGGYHTHCLDGFTVRNGKAIQGGGVNCQATAVLANCIITGNTANNGGGFYCTSTALSVFTNCEFSGNRGGGLYSSSSALVVTGSTFRGNTGSQGGGIYSGGTGTIQNCTIVGNSASSYGGGIYASETAVTIANNIVAENTAAYGGGINCSSAASTITNNLITSNAVTTQGGGISCGGSSSTILVANNTVVANVACNVNGSNGVGGGIYCSAGMPTLANNTIVGNVASGAGGGILSTVATVNVANNIVAFNSSGIKGSGGTLRSNCVYNPDGIDYTGVSAGAGDISADPKLLALDFGNAHLLAGSPCINAGYDGAIQAGWTDADGQARKFGSSVDIGADEYNGTTPTFTPAVIRVSPAGQDTGDGSSWAQAKLTIQSAVDATYARGGGEIWVAAGTYSERITLKPWVYVYGGFLGDETSRDQRNYLGHATTLDGGAGGAVVTVLPGSGMCGVDGLTITNGTGRAIDYSSRSGGGVYASAALPQISNCCIRGNTAANSSTGAGGGIYCERSWARFLNNTIRGNVGDGSGGGIYCTTCQVSIANNVISENSAKTADATNSFTYGGGLLLGSCSGRVANNTLLGNSATYGAGLSANGALLVSNNTIVWNGASRGGGVYYGGSGTLANNIIAFNMGGIWAYSGTPTLRNNCVYNPIGANYTGVSPGAGDISTDPQLLGGEFGEVHLVAGSPCIEAGDDTAVWAGTLDLDGEARKQGAHVDIGADEFNGLTPPYAPKTIRVSPLGDDSHDGSSWLLAKRTVQAAIDAAAVGGGEVWTAAGVYHERINLKQWAYVYGGFAGTETTRSERNWTANPTVLNGDRAGSVVSALFSGSASRIDGFVIRNGYSGSAGGGGVFCLYSSPIITNNTILGNRASYGAGIRCYGASPTILNNTITGNLGGAISCNYSSSFMANNVITGNTGGGITFSNYGIVSVLNNTIMGNSGASGAGIYCSNATGLIVNNIVAFNSSGIASSSGTLTLRNNCCYNPDGPSYSTGLNPGAGDISIDPGLLASADGEVHLVDGSPCINAGDDSVVQAGWTDLDGQARIQGAHVEIGADEFTGIAPPPPIPTIVRVSPLGDDRNDGSTWALAKRTVQAGIDYALYKHGEVWVAAGVYNERITLWSWVNLYGGFAGEELARAERDWTTHPTILDGGAGGSVVTVACSNRLGAIDGFTIRNGSGTTDYSQRRGGGIYASNCSARIANNTITGNTADVGGGVYGSASASVLTNNTITGNTAGENGGGVYQSGSGRLENNLIAFNIARTYGGGVYCATAWALSNNAIVGNTARSCGGGIYGDGSGTIVNNTLTGNGAPQVGALYLNSSSSTVANNILAFNSSGIYAPNSLNTLRNNCVHNPDGADYSNVTAGPGDIAADPGLLAWEYGNVHLTAASPCIAAGSDADVRPGDVDTDGEPRIQGGRVDIGADEFSADAPATFAPRIVRVSLLGDDTLDGSNWSLAKRTVQAAIEAASAAGGEVWVAAGTYDERIALKGAAYLYGGFTGTETDREHRDAAANATILDGDHGGSVVTAVHTGYRMSRIDGFTIQHGTGVLSGTLRYGGGVYCQSSPTITSNAILENSADDGGGVCCEGSSAIIGDNTILRNTAAQGGGTLCRGGAVVVTGNLIARNMASKVGGGIHCESSTAQMTGNLIVGNLANTQGGGVSCWACTPRITNCVIAGNVAATGGGGMYNYASSPAVVNCTFSANSAPSGAALSSQSGTSPLTNCIIWGHAAPAIANTDGNPVLTYCNVQGGHAGTGNIDTAPRFVRSPSPGADATWETEDDDYGDLRLLAGSPCIDAGKNAAVASGVTTDLDGHGRFYNDPATPDCQWAPGTCGTAPIVDIGAYEFIAGDYDRDGDLDSADLAVLQACISGPGVPYIGDCTKADLNRDGAVDLADFGIFQRCYSGAGHSVDPQCVQ